MPLSNRPEVLNCFGELQWSKILLKAPLVQLHLYLYVLYVELQHKLFLFFEEIALLLNIIFLIIVLAQYSIVCLFIHLFNH